MKNTTLDQINITARTDQLVYGARLTKPPIWVRNAPTKINDMEVLQEALGKLPRRAEHFPNPNPPRQRDLLS